MIVTPIPANVFPAVFQAGRCAWCFGEFDADNTNTVGWCRKSCEMSHTGGIPREAVYISAKLPLDDEAIS